MLSDTGLSFFPWKKGDCEVAYLIRQQWKTLNVVCLAPFILIIYGVKFLKRKSLWSVGQRYTKYFISVDSNYWETLGTVTFKSFSKQCHSYKLQEEQHCSCFKPHSFYPLKSEKSKRRRSQTSRKNFTTILSFTLLKIERYLPGAGIKTWLTGSSRLHRDRREAAGCCE